MLLEDAHDKVDGVQGDIVSADDNDDDVGGDDTVMVLVPTVMLQQNYV